MRMYLLCIDFIYTKNIDGAYCVKSNGIIISFAESFGIETKKNIKTSREFGQTKEKQNKKKKSPVTSFPDEFKTKTPLTRCERERE